MGALPYQTDFPSTARSWPHHKSPETSGEKPSSVPVSFNAPNTSAWNNWKSTSHHLLMPRCLLCLSYLSPRILTSSQRDAERFFLTPFVFHGSSLKCHPVNPCTSLFLPLSKRRSWFLSSTTSRRCSSTTTATIWGWGRTGPWFVTWSYLRGPRSPKTLSGSTEWYVSGSWHHRSSWSKAAFFTLYVHFGF